MPEQPSFGDHAGPNVAPDPGHDLSEPKNPDVAHEHSDVRVTGVLWAGVALAGLILLAFLIAGGLSDGLGERAERVNNANPLPLAAEKGRQPLAERIKSVPPPRLESIQVTLPEGLQEARPTGAKPEVTRLTTYGKGDEKQPGTVRIPIDVAMKVLLEKNLLPIEPKSKEASEPRPGSQRPTTSNSGRGAALEKP